MSKSIYSYLGFTFHNLADAEAEEVAARVRLRDFNQIPGVLFARKKHDRDSPKFHARNRVLKYYRPIEWNRPLEILTFPGLKWQFERVLLGQRQGESTIIHAVECDAAIYRASLQWIPGRKHVDGIRVKNSTILSTYNIEHYELIELEKFVHSPLCSIYDAAWLDFTGMLSIARVAAIRHLWENSITDSLTVTSLAARWDKKTTKELDLYRGVAGWLLAELKKSKLIEVHRYCDPVPMIQVMLSR